MNKYKCRACDKTETADDLPYGWAKVHEDAAGVHDSESRTWKYDYHLCPDCRPSLK